MDREKGYTICAVFWKLSTEIVRFSHETTFRRDKKVLCDIRFTHLSRTCRACRNPSWWARQRSLVLWRTDFLKGWDRASCSEFGERLRDTGSNFRSSPPRRPAPLAAASPTCDNRPTIAANTHPLRHFRETRSKKIGRALSSRDISQRSKLYYSARERTFGN